MHRPRPSALYGHRPARSPRSRLAAWRARHPRLAAVLGVGALWSVGLLALGLLVQAIAGLLGRVDGEVYLMLFLAALALLLLRGLKAAMGDPRR
jgi:hypothetical protein